MKARPGDEDFAGPVKPIVLIMWREIPENLLIYNSIEYHMTETDSLSAIEDSGAFTKNVAFMNSDGVHGKIGSTIAHNELPKLIDSSLSDEAYMIK